MSGKLLSRRRAGVLLHATSLPDAAHGALGRAARSFVDWLVAGGFTVWQFLPLGPVGEDRSPFYARSNHAGDPALVDLATLADWGLIERARIGHATHATLRALAATRLCGPGPAGGELRQSFAAFLARESHWLADYALFTAVQTRESGRPWWEWPQPLAARDAAALATARTELGAAIARIEAEQFFFWTQWRALREYAAGRGVRFFGDLPIYVAPDSVEVWSNRPLFQLDAQGRPEVVAGVPPDYFASDGQWWGNPLYRWEEHQRTGFAWWLDRLRAQFELHDFVRIDHFRGLEAYWAIPANAATAAAGSWRLAPGAALLKRARQEFGPLDLVAEDLGAITPTVEQLRDDFDLAGMRVAQFGFDGDPDNPHLPHNWRKRLVGYTGTHDNDTSAGWYASLDVLNRQLVADYLGVPSSQVVPALVRTVLASPARLALAPMQDLLGLGSEARMNTPATVGRNWGWRFEWPDVPEVLAARCRCWNHLYGRALR